MENIFCFVVGTVLGSFFGVLIDRVPVGESIIFGRSHCSSCGHQLNWTELFPIFSQLFSRSRCRHCGVKIALWYGFLEFLSGLVLLFWEMNIFSFSQALFILMSLILSILDIKYHEFPFIIWLSFSLLIFISGKIGSASLIWLGILLLQRIVNLKIGSGDILWLLTASFSFGFYQLVLLIEIASLTGIIQILCKKRPDEIAFIPHLSLAYLILLAAPQNLTL